MKTYDEGGLDGNPEENSNNPATGSPYVNPNQNRDQLTNSELNKEDNMDYNESQSDESEEKDPSTWPAGDVSIEDLEGSNTRSSDTNVANPEAESGNGTSIGNP